MAVTELLIALLSAVGIAYVCLRRYFSYWRRFNVVSIEPSLLFGNLKEVVMMKTSPGEHFRSLYNDKKAEGQPFVGIHVFHQPAVLLRSPEIIKQMLIKDFNRFCNRFTMSDAQNDVLGSHNLFFVKNPVWRELRVKMSPVFTSGKLKQMFHLLEDVGKKLDDHLLSQPITSPSNSFVTEVKELSTLFTTDVIASVVFGLEANCFEDPECEFRRNGRKIFEFTTWRAIEFTTVFFIPRLASLLNVKIFTGDSCNFLRSTIEFVMSAREKSGATRNDMIDILIALKNRSADDNCSFKFTQDMLIAQAAIFFTAGYETSSTLMSFVLYELSNHLDLQGRLREELRAMLVGNNGRITFESVSGMEYLDMVIQEVLRMYPPLPFLDRECVAPEKETTYSLQPFGDFQMPAGMPIFVPVYALHMDPKYFPHPEVFNPERFAPENKRNIHPFTYIPFGVGPHSCIGERFGVMQAKIGLVYFLKNHYVGPCEKSVEALKFDRKALIMQPEGGVYCEIVRDVLFEGNKDL